MKRILVPTDFSPAAEKAFRFALNIAEKAKGDIILYHTYIPVESTFIGNEKTRKQYNAECEEKILNQLKELKKRVMGDATDIAVSTIAGRSPMVDNIPLFAGENNVDLIVMGTQGASGLKKTIIGSVAARVIEKSDLPVLLIPSMYTIKNPRQFVFATDYGSSDKEALVLIEAMADLYDAGITVLHFANADGAESDKEKKQFDAYINSVQKDFNKSKIDFHLLKTTSVVKTLETVEEKFPYDIMVMVKRKKNFLERFFIGSFTRNMTYMTKKPLLIVPEKKK